MPITGGHIEEPAVEIEGFFGVEKFVQIRLFGKVTDSLILADLGGRLAKDQGIAVRGEQQAEQQFDRGGLPGAVGTQQAEYLASMDLQIECVESSFFLPAPEIPVDLGQPTRFNNHISGH